MTPKCEFWSGKWLSKVVHDLVYDAIGFEKNLAIVPNAENGSTVKEDVWKQAVTVTEK